MLNDHAQCMSLKKLKNSAYLFAGFLSNAYIKTAGVIPRIKNKIIPGTRKLLKGECSKIDNGKPPINFPDGETIKAPPPPIALKARNANKIINRYCAVFVFITFKIIFSNCTTVILVHLQKTF